MNNRFNEGETISEFSLKLIIIKWKLKHSNRNKNFQKCLELSFCTKKMQ